MSTNDQNHVFNLFDATPPWLPKTLNNSKLVLMFLRGILTNRNWDNTEAIDKTSKPLTTRGEFWKLFSSKMPTGCPVVPLCAATEKVSTSGGENWTPCNTEQLFPGITTPQYPDAIWFLYSGPESFPLPYDTGNSLTADNTLVLSDAADNKEGGTYSTHEGTEFLRVTCSSDLSEPITNGVANPLLAEAIACQHLLQNYPESTLAALHDVICRCGCCETPSEAAAAPMGPDGSPDPDKTESELAAANNQTTD